MNRRLVIIESAIHITSIVVAIILHVKSDVSVGVAISVGLATDVVGHLFGFTMRYGAVLDGIREACPPDEKPHTLTLIKTIADSADKFLGHSIPLKLLVGKHEEWYLQDRFNDIVEQLIKDLAALDKKSFRVEMKDILEPSLRVCREIKQSAFCTALEKHLDIFLTDRGRKLLEANYDAAKRLKSNGGFTRLFILQTLASVTSKIYELMSENAEHGIVVLVILRQHVSEVLKRHITDDELDFGLWDNAYRMTITGDEEARWMQISATPDDMANARKLKGDLEHAADTWVEFRDKLGQPVNGPDSAWSSFPGPEKMLHLPPPSGPYPADVKAMFEMANKALPQTASLGILGLTYGLIEHAKSLQKERENLSIEIVDCREYHPPTIEQGVLFRQSNWLNWKPRNLCDVIVGDDVLCNLGVWQLPLFFEAIANALNRGGLFIVRATAIYEPGLMHPGRQEILDRLKESKEQLKSILLPLAQRERESPIYELAWPLMHSSEFYDKQLCTFELGRWDEMIRKEFKSDTQFGNLLRLPYKLKLTSLDYTTLKTMSSKRFEILQEEMAVHSIWKADHDYETIPWAQEVGSSFQQYYRIVVFSKRAD